MSKRQSQKAGAIASGISAIVGAIAHYKRSRKWEDFHTFLVVAGVGLTLYGAVS